MAVGIGAVFTGWTGLVKQGKLENRRLRLLS